MGSMTSRSLHALPHFSSTPSPLRNGEESKAVKITVWWDIENCSIPTGVNPCRVAHRITSALRSHGIRGPLTITAFGNMLQFKQATHDALCSTGVVLSHVPNCGKNSADWSILGDLVYCVAQNPPPVHFFLISGDKDFASTLHRLRMSNYNILLASGSNGSTALHSSATIIWNWDALVRGDSLTGRHFNHPPDGLYGSWYGHCKASIDKSKEFDHPSPIIALDDVVDHEENRLSRPEEHAMLAIQPSQSTVKMKAETSKKWHADSDSKPKVPEKMAKLVTPSGKTCTNDGKKISYPVTPYPMKQPCKTVAKPQTLKPAGIAICKSCSKIFISQSALQFHIKAKHVGTTACKSCSKSFVCKSCSKIFISQSALQFHIKAKHVGTTACKSCSKSFVCKSCSKIFISQSALQFHIKAKHVGTTACKSCSKSFVCKSCSKSFISKSALQSHIKAKHVGTTACKSCSKSFISESALRSHTKAKHA